MLFSREDVASHINANFEPAWDMVRPVPIIRIDFGDGNVVTRTLHGNIASHVCTSDGKIVDILPGLYTPAIYLAALEDAGRVARSCGPVEMETLARLRNYHTMKAAGLRPTPNRIVYPRVAVTPPRMTAAIAAAAAQPGRPNPGVVPPLDATKRRMERPLEVVMIQQPARPAAEGPRRPMLRGLAESPLLQEDTWRNETERRLMIHDRLADAAVIRPEQIKRWLYKEVLHADLDDPYLGLGDTLIGDDVFGEEA